MENLKKTLESIVPTLSKKELDSLFPHIAEFFMKNPAGWWFIHDYGVDLTFNSDVKKGFGGGILIRSIEEDTTTNTITGPKNCINELWDEVVDAFSPTAPNPRIVRVKEREIELNEPDTRITVDKYDGYKSKWRFTVKGKKVSK